MIVKNKTIQYFKYAIGEIILIVIGILIALWISNWNENKINQNKETEVLSQVYDDLITNKEELNELKKRLSINSFAIDSLIVHLKPGSKSHDISLETNLAIRKSYFNNANSGYNMIQGGMAPLIKDKSRLSQILNLYEKNYKDLINSEQTMHSLINDIKKEFINKHFRISSNNMNFKFNDLDLVSSDIFEPIDLKSLVKNNTYRNQMIQLRQEIKGREILTSRSIENTEKLITVLEKRIGVVVN